MRTRERIAYSKCLWAPTLSAYLFSSCTHITADRGARFRLGIVHIVAAGLPQPVHDILDAALDDHGGSTGPTAGRSLGEDRCEWTLGGPTDALVGEAQAEL